MSAGRIILKVFKWILYVIVGLLLIFFYGVIPWFLTNIITRPSFHFHDPNDGKTPQTFGMAYQNIQFTSSDGVPLRGWYVPAGGTPRGTIVFVHGLNRSRVEMLPNEVFAHGLGYNGLLFDLRHQGQSGGKVATLGYKERHDVVAAVDYALNQEKAARPVILWGVSMGASAALMAGADSPDVAAVISDSSFLNFSDVLWHHYYLFRGFARRQWWWFPPLPGFPIVDEVEYWSAWRGGFWPGDFDLEKAVRRINPRPILFVAVAGDERMPPSIAQKLYADASSPLKAIVVVPGKRHGEGFNEARQPYEEAVTKFLNSLPASQPELTK